MLPDINPSEFMPNPTRNGSTKKGNYNQSWDDCAGILPNINPSEGLMPSSTRNGSANKGSYNQSSSAMTTVESSSRDDCAEMLPYINPSQSMGYEDIYIHKSSPQLVAVPKAAVSVDGEIVQRDSFGPQPLVDFDATNNRAHQSGVPVFNLEKKGRREELNREGLTESVLRSDDSTQPNLFGQNPSNCTASNSSRSNRRPRDKAVGKVIYSNITGQELRQQFGRKRDEVAKSIGVSVSTFKRMCRSKGIERWRDRIGSTDSCPTFKPSTHGQDQMVGNLHKPNEDPLPPDFFDGIGPSESPVAIHGQNQMVGNLHEPNEDPLPPGFFDMLLSDDPSLYEESEAHPNCNDLQCAQLQIASKEMVNKNTVSSNPASSELPSTITVTGPIAPQDTGDVTIKATYRKETIKFTLPITAGLTELKALVATRLNLALDHFHVKYTDEDGDLISMTGDDNLRDYLQVRSSVNPPSKLIVCDWVVNPN